LVSGISFNVSAAVGFISIFGIAVMDGILLSTYLRQLWDQGYPFVESIIMGCDRRLRATMMTASSMRWDYCRRRCPRGSEHRPRGRSRSW
jgi:cobalt-zinc-cadmium resistance protein CzcA